MSRSLFKRAVSSIFILSLGLPTLTATAGQDAYQQQMTKQLHETKRKLDPEEVPKATEQQSSMDENRQVMLEMMEKCRELMDQMSENHQAMMKMGCMKKV